jgi:hypothetical protein
MLKEKDVLIFAIRNLYRFNNKEFLENLNIIGYHKKWDLRGISPSALGTNPALGTEPFLWRKASLKEF